MIFFIQKTSVKLVEKYSDLLLKIMNTTNTSVEVLSAKST